MRTTINLPDSLVSNAMILSKCKTKTELFTMALNNIIRREELSELKKYRGKLKLELDLDVLRKRK